MTDRIVGYAFAVVFSLALTGCGGSKSVANLSAQHSDALKSAPPEVKAGWDAAMASMKTNGYAAAIMALQAARAQQGLTPDQGKAIDETVTAVSDQMYDAANKEDPAAKQSIEDLRQMQTR